MAEMFGWKNKITDVKVTTGVERLPEFGSESYYC
tara:strand:+ start:99 stop:200 length:102 start_codon:yes stop_codon:yes gene_type:complete